MATNAQPTLDEMTFACGIEGDHAKCQKHRLKVLGMYRCKCPCHAKKAAQPAAVTPTMEATEIRHEMTRLDGELEAYLLAGKRYTPEAEEVNKQYCALVDHLAVIEGWPDFSKVEQPAPKKRRSARRSSRVA